MNGIALTLRALHHGELSLAKELTAVAERHSAEHEVRHVARDLALWSNEHCRRLAETGGHHGLDLDGPSPFSPGLSTSVHEDTAEPALPLLRDLRALHLAAAGNSLYWEMLTQAAQAARDPRLLDLASFCHPRTLRQMRWSNTMIKNLSPQALTSP